MSKDLKLTNTIATVITAVDEDDPVVIFPAGNEARIAKILVINNEEFDRVVQLSAFIDPDTAILGTFTIPASAGIDVSVPPVDLVPLAVISSSDNAENYFFNTADDEALKIQLLDVERCDLQVIVKSELYD